MENKYTFDSEQRKNKNNKYNIKSSFIYKTGSFFILLLLFCCSLYEISFMYKRTNTGLEYKILKKNNKETVDETMYFRIEREISYKGDILEYRNQYGYIPFLFAKKDVMWKDFDGKYFEAVNLLRPGEEIIFKIKAKNIPISYRMRPINIHPEKEVLVKIALVEVFSKEEIQKIKRSFIEQREKDANEILEKQNKKIEKYLNDKKLKFEKKNKYYVVFDGDCKNQIKTGDTVKLNISLKGDDGKIIDTNIKEVAQKEKIFNEKLKYEPFPIRVVESKMWLMDCLKHLQKGGKCKIFLPTAYVENLDLSKNFLECYLEVVDVEEKKEEISKKDENIKKEEDKKEEVEKTTTKNAEENNKNINSNTKNKDKKTVVKKDINEKEQKQNL